jgi:hypothetical protein
MKADCLSLLPGLDDYFNNDQFLSQYFETEDQIRFDP